MQYFDKKTYSMVSVAGSQTPTIGLRDINVRSPPEPSSSQHARRWLSFGPIGRYLSVVPQRFMMLLRALYDKKWYFILGFMVYTAIKHILKRFRNKNKNEAQSKLHFPSLEDAKSTSTSIYNAVAPSLTSASNSLKQQNIISMTTARQAALTLERKTSYVMPAIVQAALLEFAQPILMADVHSILTSLPDTGLYGQRGQGLDPPAYKKQVSGDRSTLQESKVNHDDMIAMNNANMKTFRTFCNHVMNVFSVSPRAVLLDEIEAKISALPNQEDVKKLHELLHVKPDARFITLADAYVALEPGKIYALWNKLTEKSQVDPYTEELQSTIRQGYMRKSKQRGIVMSDEDIDIEIKRIRDDAAVKRARLGEEAKKMRDDVDIDPSYVTWQAVQTLWTELGISVWHDSFRALDRSVGEERRRTGLKFERDKAQVIFLMIKKRLLRAHPELSRYSHWNYFIGAEWRNELNKPIGEIDIVIVVKRTSGEYVVVAIVEIKSNCFELASAFTQHEEKARNYEVNSIKVPHHDKGNAYSNIELTGHEKFQQWLYSTSKKHQNIPAQGIELQLEFEPPVYVATLIPAHEYMTGAEGSIIKVMSTALYSGDVDIDNDEHIRALMSKIQTTCNLSRSPVEALLSQSQHILVL